MSLPDMAMKNTPQHPPQVFAVRFKTEASWRELCCWALSEHELDAVTWQLEDDPSCVCFELYAGNRREAASLLDAIKRISDGAIPIRDAAVHEFEPTDWQDAWKAFFHAEQISPRVAICPSWETPEFSSGVYVLRIDPGMSFGTGLHATTRSCIQLLDELSRKGIQGSLLDAGCGSGILTLAACKLGCAPVTAFDIDPQAVADTRSNLAANGLTATVRTGSVEEEGSRAYTVVVANILAPVLIEHAARICSQLKPHSHLILSGILTPQYEGVAATYASLGLHETMQLTSGEWTSGCFLSKS